MKFERCSTCPIIIHKKIDDKTKVSDAVISACKRSKDIYECITVLSMYRHDVKGR